MSTNEISLHGNALHLKGVQIKTDEVAPDFEVIDGDFNPIKLYDFKKDSVCFISAVPSLDTEICAISTKKFNQDLQDKFGDRIKKCTISMDLPFAQKRFCESEKINNIPVFSDHIKREFAAKYGLMIEELGLIGRAAIIITRDNTVKYIEIVKELSNEPNYEKVIKTLEETI